jgi:GAF domain-containing protein
MWDNIRRLLAPPVFAGDEEKTRTAALLNAVLWIFIAGFVAFVPIALFLPTLVQALPIMGLLMLVYVVSLWLMHRGHLSAASLLPLTGLWAMMIAVSVFYGGTQIGSYFASIVVVIAAGLLLSGRWGIAFAGLSIIVGIGIAWAQMTNVLPAPLSPVLPIAQWGILSAFVIAAAGLVNLASRSLREALLRARRYAAELEEQRAGLEVTVQARTRDLTRRARYLEVTAAIAREATSELELGGLMTSVVNSISRQFGFYHTGLFLLDTTGEWAELEAASSEGGQRMLARGHRLHVGQEGMVGYVSQRGEPRIVLDTGQDRVFFNNPDLPQTRSEAALPLRARGQVIGVLDVQSAEPEAFTQEDVTVLQTLADQVATAINNARLFRQVEESVEAERRAYGELAGQAWAKLIHARTDLGFVSDRQATAPAGEEWKPEMQAALESGLVTQGDAATVAIPIKVRDRVIGVIDGKKRDGSGQWTTEELALMQTLAEQSAVALESARLYQDTQRRAAREQLTRQITDNIRAATSVEDAVQRAVQEMSRALGAEMVARIGTEQELLASVPGNGDSSAPGGKA